MKLDATLSHLQATVFDTRYHKFIREMTKSTELTEQEVTYILMAYYKFAIENNPTAKFISKSAFLTAMETIFNLYDVVINERIIRVLDPVSVDLISPEAWIRLFDIYLSEPLSEKQLDFCFHVYDLNNSGGLERTEDVTLLLANFVVTDDEDVREEIVMDWLEFVMKKMDIDKDGCISFDDYTKAVRKWPVMMQCLGACIPDIQIVKTLFPTHERTSARKGPSKRRKAGNQARKRSSVT